MAIRHPSAFVGLATAALAWGGSTSLASASPAGGLLNDTPQQVPSAVLLIAFAFMGAAGLLLLLRGEPKRTHPVVASEPESRFRGWRQRLLS